MGDDTPADPHLSRAVRETLDSVVAPRVRDALIHDALILVGLGELPASSLAMRAFALGPLREVTVIALGVELADSITEEILRTLESAAPPQPDLPAMMRPAIVSHRSPRSSGPPSPRRSLSPAPPTRRATQPAGTPKPRAAGGLGRHPMPTPVPLGARRRATPIPAWPPGMNSHIRANRTDPVPPEILDPSAPVRREPARRPEPQLPSMTAPTPPVVLVASTDGELFDTLVEWFDRRARVATVATLADVVRHADSSGGRRMIVILDGKNPPMRPSALAIVLEELPGIQVVMCRASAALQDVVLSVSPATAKWIVYRDPASLDHVAAECLRLVS